MDHFVGVVPRRCQKCVVPWCRGRRRIRRTLWGGCGGDAPAALLVRREGDRIVLRVASQTLQDT